MYRLLVLHLLTIYSVISLGEKFLQPYGPEMCEALGSSLCGCMYTYHNLQCHLRVICDKEKGMICGTCLSSERALDTRTKGTVCTPNNVRYRNSPTCNSSTAVTPPAPATSDLCNNTEIPQQLNVSFHQVFKSKTTLYRKMKKPDARVTQNVRMVNFVNRRFTMSASPVALSAENVHIWRFLVQFKPKRGEIELGVIFCCKKTHYLFDTDPCTSLDMKYSDIGSRFVEIMINDMAYNTVYDYMNTFSDFNITLVLSEGYSSLVISRGQTFVHHRFQLGFKETVWFAIEGDLGYRKNGVIITPMFLTRNEICTLWKRLQFQSQEERSEFNKRRPQIQSKKERSEFNKRRPQIQSHEEIGEMNERRFQSEEDFGEFNERRSQIQSPEEWGEFK